MSEGNSTVKNAPERNVDHAPEMHALSQEEVYEQY